MSAGHTCGPGNTGCRRAGSGRSAAIAAALLALIAAGCWTPAARAQAAAPDSVAAPGRGPGNVNLSFGGKFLDDGDWIGTSRQPEIGASVDYAPAGWPVSLLAGLRYSVTRGTADIDVGWRRFQARVRADIAASTLEADLGVRKYWTLLPDLRAFASAGGAFVRARWEPQVVGYRIERTGDGFGGWLSGGALWAMSPRVNLGLELRWSSAAVTVGTREIDAGGLHAGVLAGYRW